MTLSMASYYDQPGWAVRITPIGMGDDWRSVQMFGAAFVDPIDALEAVVARDGFTAGEVVAIAGPLSASTMKALQVQPSQVWPL